MSLSDPIGDMIARVKNAQNRSHKRVDLPSSNFKAKIAGILKDEGFIKDFKIENETNKAILSTPKGVMSDVDARKNNVGGEVICRVF